jgi:hypothetical protein
MWSLLASFAASFLAAPPPRKRVTCSKRGSKLARK